MIVLIVSQRIYSLQAGLHSSMPYSQFTMKAWNGYVDRLIILINTLIV